MTANLPITRRDRGYRPPIPFEQQLAKAQDTRIHRWFVDKFGSEGEELYQRYTGKIPPRKVWKKQRPYFRIPSKFFKTDAPHKFGSIRHKYPVYSNGHVCCFERFQLTATTNNDYELRVYYEPVSRGDLIEQPHIHEDRENQLQRDGDLFLKRHGLDLAVSRKKEVIFIPEVKYQADCLDLELSIPDSPSNEPAFDEAELLTVEIQETKPVTVKIEGEHQTQVEGCDQPQPTKKNTFLSKLVQKIISLAKAVFYWFLSLFKHFYSETDGEQSKPLIDDEDESFDTTSGQLVTNNDSMEATTESETDGEQSKPLLDDEIESFDTTNGQLVLNNDSMEATSEDDILDFF